MIRDILFNRVDFYMLSHKTKTLFTQRNNLKIYFNYTFFINYTKFKNLEI